MSLQQVFRSNLFFQDNSNPVIDLYTEPLLLALQEYSLLLVINPGLPYIHQGYKDGTILVYPAYTRDTGMGQSQFILHIPEIQEGYNPSSPYIHQGYRDGTILVYPTYTRDTGMVQSWCTLPTPVIQGWDNPGVPYIHQGYRDGTILVYPTYTMKQGKTRNIN